MSDRHPILIAGPTASGKSALAVSIARSQNCVIINADALQVYACWRIMSARPSEDEEAEFPHRLFGHVAADFRYSVGDWLRDVADVLVTAEANDQRPIFVGGTGLYMKALTVGLAKVPAISPGVRAQSAQFMRTGSLAEMLNDLMAGDPEIMRTLDQKNPARVVRAWEVLKSTGQPLSHWQRNNTTPLVDPKRCLKYFVVVETTELNTRIEDRFRWMVNNGGILECRAYMEMFPENLALPSSKALGARQIFKYLAGGQSLDDAIEASVIETRQFAKRQRTWGRSQMVDWKHVSSASDLGLSK